jgi:hypothetical protein
MQPVQLRAELVWHCCVLRPLDDRREHAVDVEAERCAGRLLREPVQQIHPPRI